MPSPRIWRVLGRDISLRLQVFHQNQKVVTDIIIYFRKEYIIEVLVAIKESQYFINGLLQPL